MNKEKKYIIAKGKEYLKEYGQFFTDKRIVDFMVQWACKGASNVLDPAVGNNIFLMSCKKNFPAIKTNGYEIDKNILQFFNNTNNYNILNSDYLLSEWETKFDAIVCNPPYKKFQYIKNRDMILNNILVNTQISLSGYTNLYIYFLLKSIFQLSTKGKLAYIVPSEFLNSKYGNKIKEFLISQKLLFAIINLENNNEVFDNAVTTSCIILINKESKNSVMFFNIKNLDDLKKLDFRNRHIQPLLVNYSKLINTDKWRNYLSNKKANLNFKNLKLVSDFCRVTRGIVTGANDYFCLSKNKINNYQIPNECLTKCICKSEDVSGVFFEENDFNKLCQNNKIVYLLKANNDNTSKILHYINIGEKTGINNKYIPAHRKHWYSIEQKQSAPIWVSSAYRKTMKFIRNLANISNLTTFHSVFVNENYVQDTNLIFCYFITPTAQRILSENRKEMGNGLNKFQPNDLNFSQMLDISIIKKEDKYRIEKIYKELQNQNNTNLITELDKIFLKYLTI